MEKTPEEHIEKLVAGFREVRRVLRDDGVVFLNYGDKYSSGGAHIEPKKYPNAPKYNCPKVKGLGDGNLLGLAWRLALALQKDGWYLRSDIVWAKALSFCDVYSGSTMPESVNGWRWERHKIKAKNNKKELKRRYEIQNAKGDGISGTDRCVPVEWRDCSGCPKCEPNGGLILRKGSWRPTRAHEYLFLLAKNSSYFCDMEAVREEGSGVGGGACFGSQDGGAKNAGAQSRQYERPDYSSRNLRDVWCINPQAYPEAHYATFPEALVEPCIKVGTSQKGCCPKCGAPWARIVESSYSLPKNRWSKTGSHARTKGKDEAEGYRPEKVLNKDTTTLGWRPTCKHDEEATPCVVLDPFCGSGTVCAVAARLGRNYIGIELNENYVKDQALPRTKAAETGVTVAEQKAGMKPLFE